MLGVSAVMFSLLVSCTDLINLSHGLDDPYEGMKPTLVRAGAGQESEINTVDLSLSLQSPQMGVLWGIDWVSEWQYSWNESEPGYGVLGYSAPGLMKSTIYSVDRNTKKRYTPFYKIFDPDGGRVSLSTGYVYDILLYSYGTEYTLFSQSDDNETYTASTHINDYFTSQSEGSETDSYVDYYMPDELLGSMISSMDLSGKPSGYDKEIALDGTVTYVKPMSVTLKPFSFIYLMQIVVLKNADYSGNRIIGVKDVTVTGLAQGVDLFTGKTMDNTISITTDDIKPLQNHNNVRLDDETTVDNADILAARMLTWGLPGIVPLESTKAGTKVAVLDNNYIDITLMLRNGKTQSVSIDITEQMHNKPTGGVITVVVDANFVSLK